jgi:multidrug efflux pump subunit AcrA (membrane-fusion protein)
MAKFGEDYKFPDEVEDKVDVTVEGDEEITVDIVDDAPPEDRNINPLPEDIKEDLEKADESAEYSKNVKQKFTQYKKAWHDERRAKEAALREQQEALAAAQRILDENNRLKAVLHNGEKELISTYQTTAEMELDKAERSYKEAYDSGDSDRLLEAQKEITRAQLKLDKAKNFQPTVQPQQSNVQYQQPAQPQLDPKVANWVSKNQWFVDPNKRAMRRYAEGVHEDLESRFGRGYIGTDEYYANIDKEVKARFPEEFGSTSKNGASPRTKSSTVVAPVKRSTAPKQVVLSQSAANIAKKLGITPQQYAKEFLKLEAKNG